MLRKLNFIIKYYYQRKEDVSQWSFLMILLYLLTHRLTACAACVHRETGNEQAVHLPTLYQIMSLKF